MLSRVARRVRWSLERASSERDIRRNLAVLGGAGEGCRVHGDPHVTAPERVVLGRNVHIGTGAYIRAEGGLQIGDNTHVSRNVLIYTMNHDIDGARLPYDDTQIPRPVVIGRNVWIGMNVCIAPGSTIGDGAVVGMGTVVAGTVPPLAIVASQPCRVIGHRDEERYRSLDEAGRYSGSGGKPL